MIAIKQFLIRRYSNETLVSQEDTIAIEEPIEIALVFDNNILTRKPVSITMRTPGNDVELCLGFLFSEGIIDNKTQVEKVIHANENSLDIYISPNINLELGKLDRHFYTSSSCGVCGKSSLEAIRTITKVEECIDNIKFNKSILFKLNAKVKNQQMIFQTTGGLHASALFDIQGNFIALKEDVGRHNALDKILGMAFLQDSLPLNSFILFLSGRASFELIQKAIMGGIKIICALGAPSSLAVELATEYDITLIGFLKADSFNIYSGHHRII